jgi:hypothetical protein
MSARNKNLKLVSAAGAALALTAAVAAPSLAAGKVKASVTYSCNSGAASPQAVYKVAVPPAKMVAGQTLKLGTTATFSLNSADSGLASTVLSDPGPPARAATAVGGKIRTKTSNKAVGLALKVAKTDLGNAGSGATTASVTGNTLLRSTKVGTFTLKLGGLGLVHLVGYDTTGAKTGTVDFPGPLFAKCANPAGRTALKSGGTAATVKVVKDKTTTKVGAAFSRHQISAATKVRSTFGIKATGKVKVSLKKGTTTIKTAMVKLNRKGIAKVGFKVTKAGKYTVKSGYGGSSNLKGSSGSTSVRAS